MVAHINPMFKLVLLLCSYQVARTVWMPLENGEPVRAKFEDAFVYCNRHGLTLAICNSVERKLLEEAYFVGAKKASTAWCRYVLDEGLTTFRDLLMESRRISTSDQRLREKPDMDFYQPRERGNGKYRSVYAVLTYVVDYVTGKGHGFETSDNNLYNTFLCSKYIDTGYGANRYKYPVCSPNTPHLECVPHVEMMTFPDARKTCRDSKSLDPKRNNTQGFLPSWTVQDYNMKQMNYRMLKNKQGQLSVWTGWKRKKCEIGHDDFHRFRDVSSKTCLGASNTYDADQFSGFWMKGQPDNAGIEGLDDHDSCCVAWTEEGHDDVMCDGTVLPFYCVFDHTQKAPVNQKKEVGDR